MDVKNKFIRKFEVTDASVHDSRVFKELLDEDDTNGAVWADSAYGFYRNLWYLGLNGYRDHIQRKGKRNRLLSKGEQDPIKNKVKD